MIDALFFNNSANELNCFKQYAMHIAARISDENWNLYEYNARNSLKNFLSKNIVVDFACLDISKEKNTEDAESLRKENDSAFIMLIADSAMSPMEYLKPSVMPGALLLRPFSAQQMQETLNAAITKFMEKHSSGETESDSFRLQMKQEIKIIPFSQIYYFEAREKKVYINVGNTEYASSNTIDSLEKMLPAKFVRCHRSFIVAKPKIKNIYVSKGYIELDNNMTVPLSRNYKAELKELK